MTYWKSQQFMALQKSWYLRLEELGFEDIEVLSEDGLKLKQSSHYPLKDHDLTRMQCKELYYILLSQKLLEEPQFKNEIDRFILTAHSEGIKITEICQQLEEKGQRRCRRTVRVTIRRYVMRWGIRFYTPEQLNRYQKSQA